MQQYITNVDYKYKGAKRKAGRKRQPENKEAEQPSSKKMKMSADVSIVKSDERKLLGQVQIGLNLLELLEKMYDPEVIKSDPVSVQKNKLR